MSLRLSPTLRFLAIVVLMAHARLLSADRSEETWHTADGHVIKGRLAGVYGSTLVISGKDIRALVPLDKITDQELVRVADYLATEAKRTATWETSTASVTKSVRKHLEFLSDGKVVDWSPSGPEPRLYLAYFSAGWCGPCHRFTPSLVKAYKDWQARYAGQVEIILVSWDRNTSAYRDYVKEMNMPWKALDFTQNGRMPVLEKWAGNGIPCLVAMTPDGDVLFHSYRGEEYLGPGHVVESTEQLLAQSADTPAARLGRHRLAVVQHVRARPESAPVLYAAIFDPRRYQTLEANEVQITFTVNPRGVVTDAEVETSMSGVLKDKLLRDLQEWLFLPAVSGGVAVERKVSLPIQLRQKKIASTAGAITSGN